MVRFMDRNGCRHSVGALGRRWRIRACRLGARGAFGGLVAGAEGQRPADPSASTMPA